MKLMSLTIAAVFLTGAASAQSLVFNPDLTAACLKADSSHQAQLACIGTSANACMEETQGGYSTVGMGGCLGRELDWWDARLNASYKTLMKQEKADDLEFGAGQDGVPSKADALKAMQRAWITFRDTSCAYEYSKWGGGTGGGPAIAGCLLDMTARQTLALETSEQRY